jgi:Tfp pilus assembly protein PilF
LALGLAAATSPSVARPAPSAGASSASELAFERFRAKDYQAARSAFDEAASAATADDAATLRFNAAVCAYQLADYADAQQRFVTLADKYPELAALALLHAGLAALGLGDTDRARQLLARAPRGDKESDEIRAELERELAAAARSDARKAFEAHVQRGLAAFKAERWSDAERELEAALLLPRVADGKELASVYYLLSNSALARGDSAAARRYADASVARDAQDALLEVQRGDVAAYERDVQRAEQSYRRALELGLDQREAPRVRAKLDALYPVPRAGAYAWAEAGGGYDSNAAQSGLAEAIAATETSERSDSPFTTLSGSTGYVFRLAPRLALGPYYGVDWLVLFDAAVRELSLQSHTAGARLDWAPRPGLELRFTSALALTLTGLEQTDAFAFETHLGAEAALAYGARTTALARVDVRGIYGLGGRDYLTGTRLDAALGENVRWQGAELLAGAGFRYNAIGAGEVALRQELVLGCGPLCDGLVYRVPFGYLGPWLDLRFGYDLTRALHAEANFRFEYRHYDDQSFITLSDGPPQLAINPKTRHDLRIRPGARLELQLDAARRWQLAADYSVWISRSNVAFAEGDPEHALDYDDRNFVQHVIALSLGAQF